MVNGVFKDKSGSDLRFRSIDRGTGITATQNADDITLTDSITPSNLGPVVEYLVLELVIILHLKVLQVQTVQ